MLADLIGEAEGDVSIWESRMAELEEATAVPDRATPSGLVADLREYQQAGFRWLAWLRDRSFGGVLADDMGLGKTVQALTLLLDEHQHAGGANRWWWHQRRSFTLGKKKRHVSHLSSKRLCIMGRIDRQNRRKMPILSSLAMTTALRC